MSVLTESCVIGSIVYRGNEAMSIAVSEGVTREWFTDPDLAVAWSTLFSRFSTGKSIDAISLVAAGSPEAGVMQWVDRAEPAAHLREHIAHVRGCYHLRLAAAQAEEARARIKAATPEEIASVVASVQQAWTSFGTQRASERPIADIAGEMVESWSKPEDPKAGACWPLRCMDADMVQLTDEYVILAARPSIGKTAFALQMMLVNAQRGVKTSMASLESKAPRIAMRLISQVGRVNTLRLRKRQILRDDHEAELGRARDAVQKMRDLNLVVSDHAMNVEQLFAWAIGEKANGSKLLIIDNFKHIRSIGKFTSTVEEFRSISKAVKKLRDDTGMPVMVLHHLNKEGDMSWSDDIRRDADIMIVLEPLDPDAMASPETPIRIRVEKDRDGIKDQEYIVKFKAEHQTFEWNHGPQEVELPE